MTVMAVVLSREAELIAGDRVAKYAGEHVHQIVKKQQAFSKEEYAEALQDGFIATNTALLEGKLYISELR